MIRFWYISDVHLSIFFRCVSIAQCHAVKHSQFSHKYPQKTSHSSLVRARYGMSFVDQASAWYSASVPIIIYGKSYNTEPRYNGTDCAMKHIEFGLIIRRVKQIFLVIYWAGLYCWCIVGSLNDFVKQAYSGPRFTGHKNNVALSDPFWYFIFQKHAHNMFLCLFGFAPIAFNHILQGYSTGNSVSENRERILFEGCTAWTEICWPTRHYSDVMMSAMAYQITGVSIAYSNICSGANQRKHESSASLAFMRGNRRWPVKSPHKGKRGTCFHLKWSLPK